MPEAFGGLAPRLRSPGMALPEWHIAVKLADQPLAPKSILRLPETELGECPLGGCSISCLKQLITGRLQESVPDPELIGTRRGGGAGLRRAPGMGGPRAGGAGPGGVVWRGAAGGSRGSAAAV